MSGENPSTDAAFLIDGCDTIPKLFLKKSVERGDKVAMREKDFGIWQSYTWDDFRERAMEVAHGLLALGLRAGDVVSIQSEDCKEWVFADLGIMLCGGVVNGVYPTYQSNQVSYTLNDSNCRFLFVEDEEQLDKYLEVEAELPNIERVIVFDWKGLRGLSHDKVMPIDRLYTLGQEYGRDHQGQVEDIVAQGDAGDLAVQLLAPALEQRIVSCVLHQRMFENVSRLGWRASPECQARISELTKNFIELGR